MPIVADGWQLPEGLSMTDDTAAAIVAMRSGGMAFARIARVLEMPLGRVKDIAKRAGAPAFRPSRLPAWEILKVELKTSTQADIARRYGVEPSAITHRRNRAKAKAASTP